MDNDRYRSTGRRIVNGSSADTGERPASAQRRVESTAQSREEVSYNDAPVYPQEQSTAPAKSGRLALWAIAAVVLIVVIAAGWLFLQQQRQDAATGIDSGKYQAVFLSNGQHYFGKLERMNADYFKLKDVYYLEQKGDTGASETTKQTAVELRKLGDKEVHGPESEMIIAKEHVLLYENLKDKSQVVTLIGQQK